MWAGRRRGAWLLHENFSGTKQHRAGAPPRFAHPTTKVGEVPIGVYDVALGGLTRHLIVPAVVEGDP